MQHKYQSEVGKTKVTYVEFLPDVAC